MSSDAPDDPRGGVSAEPQTEVQTTESVDSSVEISLPATAVQNASAPIVPGYVLTELLGLGAYGQVWRAWQRRTRKEVAVKVFIQRSGLDWIFLQREVERLLRLDRHHHVVTLLDADLSGEPPFYVIDLLEGGSLAQFVDPASCVSPDRAMRWMREICDALSYVHGRGLIHCDLKPANLLLDEQDDVRVVDFGQSRVFTESAASLGTLFYMPPEQAMVTQLGNPTQPDVRWDIYALGGTLYSILTGRVPHATPENHAALEQAETLEERLTRYRAMVASEVPAEELRRLEQHVDRELAAVVTQCLAPKADDRYNNMTEIMADLQAIQDKRPVTPLAGDTKYRIRKFVQRNPIAIALVAAVLLLVVGGFVASAQRVRLDQAEADEILAMFLDRPDAARSRMDRAAPRARRFLDASAVRALASTTRIRRVMGVRSVPWMSATTLAAFWKSVDGGALWAHGEWLGLYNTAVPEPDPLLPSLRARATDGSDREKYVAFCLIGARAAKGSRFADLCTQAVGSETDPGVVSAAWWAARRLGAQAPYTTTDRIFVDEHSGMVFARIPPAKAFRPGSPPEEEGRYFEPAFSEDFPKQGTPIKSIWVAVTETTLAQFAPFHRAGLLASQYAPAVQQQLEQTDPARHAVTAVRSVRPIDAYRFCAWLTDTAGAPGHAGRYRLPTETEWEYACRGGHPTAFCYGDSQDYLKHFAVHGGEDHPFEVATRLPNAYGLFDMHGNLWEICDSPFRAGYDDPEVADRSASVVQRGGSIHNAPRGCRSAVRNFIPPTVAADQAGFRVVLEREPSP